MLKAGMWIYNDNPEYWGCSEGFETKEEAVNAGRKDFIRGAVEGDTFFIGKLKDPEVYTGVTADTVIDMIVDEQADNCGEQADGYLIGVPKEQEQELDWLLKMVIEGWIEKNNLQPDWFIIEDVEEFDIFLY